MELGSYFEKGLTEVQIGTLKLQKDHRDFLHFWQKIPSSSCNAESHEGSRGVGGGGCFHANGHRKTEIYRKTNRLMGETDSYSLILSCSKANFPVPYPVQGWRQLKWNSKELMSPYHLRWLLLASFPYPVQSVRGLNLALLSQCTGLRLLQSHHTCALQHICCTHGLAQGTCVSPSLIMFISCLSSIMELKLLHTGDAGDPLHLDMQVPIR